MANKKILVISAEWTFSQRDLDILRKHFDGRTVRTHPKRMKLIKRMLIILKILKGTLWANLTFTWFASGAAFAAVLFSRILGKKSIVIVGGYDVANIPELVEN